jgi:hypothetical protein
MSSPVLVLIGPAPPLPVLIDPPDVALLPPPEKVPVVEFAEHAAPVAAITPARPNKNKALRDMVLSILSSGFKAHRSCQDCPVSARSGGRETFE